MLRTRTERRIACPRDRVFALFADHRRWPGMFPRVHGTRLLDEAGAKQRIEVAHDEGTVMNVLTLRPPDVIELEETKRRYDARFVHRFEADGQDTRVVIDAEVRCKGVLAFVEPFLAPIVRRQLQRYTLEPLQRHAEDRRNV